MSPYRIFFVYRMNDLRYLHVHGMDMVNKKLFTVLLYSPDDSIDLTLNTEHLPQELLETLSKEKENIDGGSYDLAHWQPMQWNQDLNALKTN
ncbi:hypothetical protein M1K46_14715 [Fictibacillus sp. WQ 8-8]|uniref:hypothetical protein n=1 Tax=unclassified Fictibacillus TaxID=2644029 RepID=UPI0006A7646F|nr:MULTISPECIES: hypothetical protein [unclassified Fictibacillus]MCQ6266905.1 hypothetical protein [Fictibacillus sp. WQ 8-8]UZJ78067.1 hypothetical protein OKX00_18230 [Fictibacillus sp. KU28468]SFF15456.1 hypothetical protein SAMN05428981_1182 [Bacillus sp. OV194]